MNQGHRIDSRLAGWTVVALVVLVVATACASGPSQQALDRNEQPSTTTTTEPLPEGIVIVNIRNGSFSPANLELDLEENWIVRWENQDEVEYVIQARRGEWESPPIGPGESFELDFSEFEPAIHRYITFRGNNRIPGQVDTRGAQ